MKHAFHMQWTNFALSLAVCRIIKTVRCVTSQNKNRTIVRVPPSPLRRNINYLWETIKSQRHKLEIQTQLMNERDRIVTQCVYTPITVFSSITQQLRFCEISRYRKSRYKIGRSSGRSLVGSKLISPHWWLISRDSQQAFAKVRVIQIAFTCPSIT